MIRRYRVTYSSEDGRRHSVGVWASCSAAARQKVESMEEADYVIHTRRANGWVVVALVALGVGVLLSLSAIFR